jgi:hypothetical protein
MTGIELKHNYDSYINVTYTKLWNYQIAKNQFKFKCTCWCCVNDADNSLGLQFKDCSIKRLRWLLFQIYDAIFKHKISGMDQEAGYR